MAKELLVVCTHNAVRSQMAEAVVNRHMSEWKASSAGTAPASVNPLVLQVLEEQGYDVSGLRSKGLQEFVGKTFDLVVTVCDGAAESCVNFPGPHRRLHLPLQDPVATHPDDESRVDAIKALLDWMRAELPTLIKALP
jgi:arsenate reductase